MSHVSSSNTIDFWDFVGCSKCNLQYSVAPGAPPQIPFWLTECGHTLCNNHLNSDQSCALCGEPGIELVPLHRDLEPPMSDWFASLPQALDRIAYAAKFQQETMARQLQYYRSKYEQQKSILKRVKADMHDSRALQSELEALRSENSQLREQMGAYHTEPSHFKNQNGKRPMTGLNPRSLRGGSSSPHSIITPIAPDRLTVPIGQAAPTLSRRPQERGSTSHGHAASADKPGTENFAEQYAYASPQTPQFRRQPLSYAQAAPLRQAQARPNQDQRQKPTMPPPPVPPQKAANFEPHTGQTLHHPLGQPTAAIAQEPHRRHSFHNRPADSSYGKDGPPLRTAQPEVSQSAMLNVLSTPRARGHHAMLPSDHSAHAHSHPKPQPQPPQSARRFQPLVSSNRFRPAAGSGSSLRSVPDTPSGGPRRFMPPSNPNLGSSGNSRAANLNPDSAMPSGSRMPFVPGHGDGSR